MKISYIVLYTHDGIDKGNSIKHVLHMISQQTYKDSETILIKNGPGDMSFLKNNNYGKISIIEIPNIVSRGKARNIGVQSAVGDFFVFLDDDAILRSNEEIGKIIKHIEEGSQFGYGAIRRRTKPLWFQKNTDKILLNMESNIDSFIDNLQEAPEFIRDKKDVRLLNYSFISHFGFCNKKLFRKIGGFPEFERYGFEDYAITLLLYKTNEKYSIISDCEIIHVTHKLPYTDDENLCYYYDFLIKNDTFRFDIGATLDKGSESKKIILPLGVFHPDYRLLNAYNFYKKLTPGNISFDDENLILRRDSNQFSLLEYIQLYNKLSKNKAIDSFIKNSEADFDNLIPFLYSLIIHKLIIDKEKGEVSLAMDFKYFPKYDLLPVSKKLLPKQELNQFPCDEESRMKRIQLIKERYPYTDYLKIALIGDDDLISKLLLPERWLHVSIIEKDMEVIQCIPQNSNCSIIEYDITSLDINKLSNYSVATFLTDPPYTLHGILAFIYTGLSILDIDGSTREFYVIINPTILGKKDLLEIQKKLSSIGIWIEEIHVGFSNYELPLHFSETTRKDIFLEKIKASQKIIRYSSSSNLYIMRTIQPDIIVNGLRI